MLKMGLFFHAITHDLSKFRPSEFFPYARFFYNKNLSVVDRQFIDISFNKAWLLHQHRNKHHWDYWVNSDGIAILIPEKYIKQMVADWKGMSRVFGDSAKDYFDKNYKSFILHPKTLVRINFYI